MHDFASAILVVMVACTTPAVGAEEALPDVPKEEQVAAKTLEAIGTRLRLTDGRVTGVYFDRARANAGDIEELRHFQRLTDVGIGQIPLTDDVIRQLNALPEVKSMQFSVQASDVESLARLNQLTHVTYMRPTGSTRYLTDDALGQIRFPAQLKRLSLTTAYKLTDEGMRHLADLPNLEWLELGCKEVTDSGLLHLGSLTKLRHLELGRPMTKVTGAAFRQLPWARNLKYLNIRNFSESMIDHIVATMPELSDLYIVSCPLGDADLEKLSALPSLKSLNISGTKVSDQGLAYLPRMKLLEDLVLYGCSGITDEGLQHLLSMKQLKNIWLQRTRVTPAGSEALKAAIPGIKIHIPTE